MTTVQDTANSSAWKHIFNFQRRGPPRKMARKLLELCHTHRSAPRSPYLPCPNYGSKGKLGARVELQDIPQEKVRGSGGSNCRFDRKISKKKVRAIHHRWKVPASSYATCTHLLHLHTTCVQLATLACELASNRNKISTPHVILFIFDPPYSGGI